MMFKPINTVAQLPAVLTAEPGGLSTVYVSWIASTDGDTPTRYRLFFEHPSGNTTITVNWNITSYIFHEQNEGLRVYAVSIQALTEHIPSGVLGPVTVRGELFHSVFDCFFFHSNQHFMHIYIFSHVQLQFQVMYVTYM